MFLTLMFLALSSSLPCQLKKKREKNLIPGFMDLNPGSGDGQFAQLFVPTFLICKTEMQYLIQGILRVKWVIMHVKCLEQCLAHGNDSVNTSCYYLLICSSAEGGDSVKIYRNLTLCWGSILFHWKLSADLQGIKICWEPHLSKNYIFLLYLRDIKCLTCPLKKFSLCNIWLIPEL